VTGLYQVSPSTRARIDIVFKILSISWIPFIVRAKQHRRTTGPVTLLTEITELVDPRKHPIFLVAAPTLIVDLALVNSPGWVGEKNKLTDSCVNVDEQVGRIDNLKIKYPQQLDR
jgi:hypothetical protein